MEAFIIESASGMRYILETGTVVSARAERTVGKHNIPRDVRIVTTIKPDNPKLPLLEAITWSRDSCYCRALYYEIVKFHNAVAFIRSVERHPLKMGRRIAFLAPTEEGGLITSLVSPRGLHCSISHQPGQASPVRGVDAPIARDWFFEQS